jgi:hypothetical protein
LLLSGSSQFILGFISHWLSSGVKWVSQKGNKVLMVVKNISLQLSGAAASSVRLFIDIVGEDQFINMIDYMADSGAVITSNYLTPIIKEILLAGANSAIGPELDKEIDQLFDKHVKPKISSISKAMANKLKKAIKKAALSVAEKKDSSDVLVALGAQ